MFPHYRPWRPTGDVDARVYIFTATALGSGRVASPTLGRLYPRGKPPVLILEEAEWTSGPVWTRRSEEKSPPLRHPGSNPGRPARSPAPCRLSYLAHNNNNNNYYYYYLFIYLSTRSYNDMGFFKFKTNNINKSNINLHFIRIKYNRIFIPITNSRN